MSKVQVYNQEGESVGEEILNPAIFNLAVKPEVIQQVVVSMQANARKVLAVAKDKSAVRGGGKKPWKQKGTGRARHGSSRSPIWKGGGVTFGPVAERNFTQKINKKVKRKAIFMSLSDKAANQNITLLDKLELKNIKTKDFFAILKNLKLRVKINKLAASRKKDSDKENVKVEKPAKKVDKSILLVIPQKDDKILKSAKNISRLKVINVSNLNVVDLLKYQILLIPVPSLKKMEEIFLSK